jgi:transcriptional regulator with XRE-family HTH domain
MQERQKRLAQLIEQLLQEGWTQKKLAERIGVDATTVYRWLKAKVVPECCENSTLNYARNIKNRPVEDIKQEVLAQITLLEPADILDVISKSVNFLAAKTA